MLEKTFSAPVRIKTYDGDKNLTDIKTDKLYTSGLDKSRHRISLPRSKVLFAYASEDASAVKSYIKIRTPLRRPETPVS